jgi:hypothetical protein
MTSRLASDKLETYNGGCTAEAIITTHSFNELLGIYISFVVLGFTLLIDLPSTQWPMSTPHHKRKSASTLSRSLPRRSVGWEKRSQSLDTEPHWWPHLKSWSRHHDDRQVLSGCGAVEISGCFPCAHLPTPVVCFRWSCSHHPPTLHGPADLPLLKRVCNYRVAVLGCHR